MYGKALTDDDIKTINTSTIDQLNDIALQAYKTQLPMQKLFSDAYMEVINDKQAALIAGYSANSLNPQLSRLRINRNICLYISCKQEIEKRIKADDLKKESETNDADKEISKAACRAIINDPQSKKTEILSAIDILAKLNGVYKEAPNVGKNRSFSVKKPENMRNSEVQRANKGNRATKPVKLIDTELCEDD